MAHYATREQMIKAFGEDELIQRTDHLNIGQIDDDVLNLALDDATSEINSYIGKRYGLTLLSSTPPRLVGICCDIARYRLYDDVTTDTVRDRYTDAIAFLKDVRDGKNNLGDEEAPAGGQVLMQAAPRRFDRYHLKDY